MLFCEMIERLSSSSEEDCLNRFENKSCETDNAASRRYNCGNSSTTKTHDARELVESVRSHCVAQ